MGAEDSPELRQLVALFQKAKAQRAAEEQLHRLNLHFCLKPKLDLNEVVGTDGNITDRQLCLAVARVTWPKAEAEALLKGTGAIRKTAQSGRAGLCRLSQIPSELPAVDLAAQKARG